MRRRGVRGTVQLLFARHDHESLLLDLIALEDLVVESETMPSGTPFVLGIRASRRMWYTDTLVAALAEAAEGDAIVDLEISDDGTTPTAIIRIGDTELVLEIDLSVHG